MLEVRPLDEAAINHVVANMWERGQDECEAFCMRSTWEVTLQFASYIGSPYAIAIWNDGVPVIICGANEIGLDEYRTWFLATEEFNRIAKPITRALRSVLAKEGERVGARAIEARSLSSHPSAQRWFQILGFSFVGFVDGGVSLYVMNFHA